jgi:peroxiredoxin
MRQLVQLQGHADNFKSLNAELIFVFREEADGVDGLKKIKDQHPTSFTLALDPEKKSSRAYSPAKMTFNNYVIDTSGVVRGIVDGTLKDRATADELTRILKEIQTSKE